MKKLNLPERSPALGRDEAVSVGRGSPERGAGPGVPPDQVLVLRSRGQGVAGGQVRHVTAEDRQILTLDRRHGGPGLIRGQGVARGWQETRSDRQILTLDNGAGGDRCYRVPCLSCQPGEHRDEQRETGGTNRGTNKIKELLNFLSTF